MFKHSVIKDLHSVPVHSSPSDQSGAPYSPILDDDEAGLDKGKGKLIENQNVHIRQQKL